MYKIIIADDEDLIRTSIRESVRWKNLDCRIVLEASDGQEVLDYLSVPGQEADLILLDINMPGMDGLTLAEKLKGPGSNPVVLIISAYQDFGHVKKALQLGVADYIAKPIRDAELIENVEKALTLIDKKREKILKDQRQGEYYSQTRALVQAEILEGYLTGDGEYSDLESQIDLFPEEGHPYSTLVMKQICKPQYVGVNKRYILEYLTREPFFSRFDIKSTAVRGDVVSIVFFPPDHTLDAVRNDMESICAHLMGFIQEWEYVHAYIGISSVYYNLSDLGKSYQGALLVAENQFFSHSSETTFSDGKRNLRDFKFSIIHDLDTFYQNLSSRVSSSGDNEIESYISGFLDKIARYSQHNIERTKSLISEVCITVARLYLNTKKSEMNDYTVSTILKDIEGQKSMEEAKEYVFALIKKLKPEQDVSYSPAVQSSLSYIRNNFHDNISLDILSEKMELNSSYLSRLLKKETGQNFSDIVLNERLRASRDLLRETNLRLYEIADRVGYRDYAYFYQVFKKNEGMTPMDYRKRNRSI